MSEPLVLEGVLHFRDSYGYLSLDDEGLGEQIEAALPFERDHDVTEFFLSFGRVRITIERLPDAEGDCAR